MRDHDPLEILHRPLEPVMPASDFARGLLDGLRAAAQNADPAPTPPTRQGPVAEPASLVPNLCAPDAREAVAFYERAFGAVEIMRLVDPKDGRIGHSELSIQGVMVFLNDEYPEIRVRNPRSAGLDFTVFTMVLNVADADALFDRAVAAGAIVHVPMTDQFYGHRSGTISDPYGYVWTLSSPIEELSPDVMQLRYDDQN